MTDTNAMREAVAQIIEPTAWKWPCASRHNREDSLSKADAILALLATDRAAGVGEEALVYANCKGMIGDLPGGRDPEEFCDTCYRDALAASLPAPADASSLDPLLCRCENARRKGIPMLCVQCTGPVGSQTAAGAK